MKLVEMKCKNCGQMLKVEEGATTITCEYCHTTYSIDDEAQHVKYDNMYESGYEFEKGRMQAQGEQFENAEKVVKGMFGAHVLMTIFGIIFFIVFVSVFMFIVYNIHQMSSNHSSFSLNMERESFNRTFEMYTGTKNKFFVDIILDKVVENNRKDSFHTITVVYNDTSTSNPDEIAALKHSIKDTPAKYEVGLDYNGDGVVYKVIITDIQDEGANL